MAALSALFLQELQAGRDIEEKVFGGNHRALRRADDLALNQRAAIQVEAGAHRLARGTSHKGHAADGSYRRKGLAAKTEGGDAIQVPDGFELAGRIAKKGQLDLGAGDAAAVIRYADHALPALQQIDRNMARACVERVFN